MPSRSGWALAALALLLIGGGFAAGYFVADDSDQVDSLQADLDATNEQLATTEDDLDTARSSAELLQDDLDKAIAKRKEAEDQLNAQLDFSGQLETPQSGSGPPADYALNQAGEVGPFIFNPTSFTQTSVSGDQAVYTAVISTKSNADSPTDPFCGGDGAAVLDVSGARYTGDSKIASDTANCGDSLQPGLTIDNYEMTFKMPTSAKPAVLQLWGDFLEVPEKDAGRWSIDG